MPRVTPNYISQREGSGDVVGSTGCLRFGVVLSRSGPSIILTDNFSGAELTMNIIEFASASTGDTVAYIRNANGEFTALGELLGA